MDPSKTVVYNLPPLPTSNTPFVPTSAGGFGLGQRPAFFGCGNFTDESGKSVQSGGNDAPLIVRLFLFFATLHTFLPPFFWPYLLFLPSQTFLLRPLRFIPLFLERFRMNLSNATNRYTSRMVLHLLVKRL